MKFIIYILSIKNCERRIHVENLKKKLLEKGFFVEIVDAIYWKECDLFNILKEINVELRTSDMSRSQIACFLTHRKAWEIINEKDSNDDIHIIIEDDMDVSDDFSIKTLENVYESIQKNDYDSIFLYKHPEQVSPHNESYNEYLLKHYFQWGFCAYSISTNFAKELLSFTKYIDLPLDNQLQTQLFETKKNRIFYTVNDYFNNLGYLGGYRYYGDHVFNSTIWG
jgi:glycosyl transferase family 25